ncbi:MAG: murein biosynthesis integral membrane protein MurJ [Candidatus Poribacteria bacterium]|nr:murein biosynthesis integral membrane protein MurJ [Candidatus Poribacteria bacterium]MDE0506469.1 murein biosynthesis integral membrane protein MurJ [Candidatus Poribacteria bacterium]
MEGENPTTITKSAGIVGVAVMVSRLLGLMREQAIAYLFAAGIGADAFYAAFRIPNLVRDLFGEGVLSKAFVRTFTATELEDGKEAAQRLASQIFNLTAVVLAILCLIGIFAAPSIVKLMTGGEGFDNPLASDEIYGLTDKRDLTVYLTRIMFPFLILVSFAAIAMGLLNSKGKFGVPACASSFFNLGSLIVGVWGYYVCREVGLHPTTGLAVGVLVGGALQFLVQTPSMWRVGFRYRPSLSFRDPRVLQVVRLITPAVIGAAALQINLFINIRFASQGEGWITYLVRAFRLMHLPIGVFGVAISTAALPNLSKMVVQDRIADYRKSFSYSLRLIILFTLPASVGLMVLSEPICRLIFEWGKSTQVDTLQTAGALFFYAIGLCSFSAVKITTDGFYAFNNTRTPVIVSILTVVVNIVLNYVFIFHLRLDHRAIAFSISCTTTLNFFVLLILLHRKVGGLGLEKVWILLAKVIVSSIIMGAICWTMSSWIESVIGVDGVYVRLISVFSTIILGLITLLCLCKLLRVKELDHLVNALLRRRV